MKKKNPAGADRNLILLIILFILISLVILVGRFIFKNPLTTLGTEEASTAAERPVINRVRPEEPRLEIHEEVDTPDTGDKPVQDAPAAEKTEARLFYFWVSHEGDFSLKSVLRPVDRDRYTVEGVIAELLKGPAAADVDRGYISFIPRDSRLNQVRLVSGTVRLDFSEEFSFNPLGYEGFNAQLKQIVYTVTEFPQIHQVLFTIDGELREYINGEGIFTGEPLSRESFQGL